MKVMIGRNERGRALIKTVDRLNLQDLSRASDAQIRAVTNLVWEIKRLFYALIMGKASDVLADLKSGRRGEAECEPRCRSDRQHPARCGHQCAAAVAAQSRHGNGQSPGCGQHGQAQPACSAKSARSSQGCRRPSLKRRREKPMPRPPSPMPAKRRSPPTSGLRPGRRTKPTICSTPRRKSFARSARPGGAAVKGYTAYAGPDGGKETPSERTAWRRQCRYQRRQESGPGSRSGAAQPKAADQTDDLLNPTEDELRGTAAPSKGRREGSPA